MADISFNIKFDGKNGSRKLNAFDAKFRGNLKRGLRGAGKILSKSAKRKIQGEGFTRNPTRSSDYPGVLSGQMLKTLMWQMIHSNMGVQVGPNVEYGPYLEFGTKNMPARPFMGDTWKEEKDDAIKTVNDAVMGPIRK